MHASTVGCAVTIELNRSEESTWVPSLAISIGKAVRGISSGLSVCSRSFMSLGIIRVARYRVIVQCMCQGRSKPIDTQRWPVRHCAGHGIMIQVEMAEIERLTLNGAAPFLEHSVVCYRE